MPLPAHESLSPVPPTRGRLDELKNPQLWSVASTLGAITMMWTTYNEYVPQFLTGVFALPALVVVLVLTLDNMLGFFMEPVTGLLSDQTITRWGRRLPWILGAMPVAVACLALLPLPALAAQSSLRAMLNPFALFVVGMLVAMALLRTPTVALMPDLVDSPGRPIANGLLQALSGAGALAALWVGGWLVEHFGAAAPFWLASATMVVATLLLWRTLRRREGAPPERLPSPHPAAPARRTERLALMGAITGWWLGYLFLNALFGDYAARRWNLSQDQSALLLRLFLLSYAIAALPVSLLAERWGRRRTVLLCTGLLLGAIGALLLPIPLPLAVGLLSGGGHRLGRGYGA